MFKKHTLLTILLFALLLVIGGCNSLQDKPTQNPLNSDTTLNPGDTVSIDNAEILSEARAFNEALQHGRYRFSIDGEGNLIPYDGINIPKGEEDLYSAFKKWSEISNSRKGSESIACSALPGDWRYAVWREICYALSRTKYLEGQYGQSRRDYTWNGARWLAGDWDYDGLGYGRGGSCKYFASRIVNRATGGRYSLPAGYNYAGGDISWACPGDVIQRSDRYGTPHTAIVYTILSRDGSGRATSIDVIDANFIGGMGSEMIARHYLPYGSHSLRQYAVW